MADGGKGKKGKGSPGKGKLKAKQYDKELAGCTSNW